MEADHDSNAYSDQDDVVVSPSPPPPPGLLPIVLFWFGTTLLELFIWYQFWVLFDLLVTIVFSLVIILLSAFLCSVIHDTGLFLLYCSHPPLFYSSLCTYSFFFYAVI